MAWKSSDGNKHASKLVPQIETLLVGMLAPATLLDLVRNFIVFEKTKKENADGLTQVVTEKKIAAYHQFYAVNKAIERTLAATDANGDKRGGVVWHTQGSGKSLSMVFYAGKLVQQFDNPTIVVLIYR
jgi:type I restriction enzyme R subunit